ncbi:MAG: Hpt sensor hybrid histidine kinase [Magnetococcales bacterium]|nr:Hpt sensor hybrid histidine kinase [Magnetococcales bacterium]HIJ83146.1 hypothetical protein [Magnetococcales bacterium]
MKKLQLPDFLDGVDMLEGLANMDDNRSLYCRVLGNMAQRCRHFMDQLEAEKKRGDWGEVRRMFHTLKGLAGTVGAMELRDCAREVEMALDEEGGGGPGVDELMPRFGMALERVVTALSAWDKSLGLVPVGEDDVRREGRGLGLVEALAGLENALLDGDGEVKKKLAEVTELLGENGGSEVFGELSRQVDDYDFDQALPTLRRLRVMLAG